MALPSLAAELLPRFNDVTASPNRMPMNANDDAQFDERHAGRVAVSP